MNQTEIRLAINEAPGESVTLEKVIAALESGASIAERPAAQKLLRGKELGLNKFQYGGLIFENLKELLENIAAQGKPVTSAKIMFAIKKTIDAEDVAAILTAIILASAPGGRLINIIVDRLVSEVSAEAGKMFKTVAINHSIRKGIRFAIPLAGDFESRQQARGGSLAESRLRHLINEDLVKTGNISDGMTMHIRERVGVERNIFRPGSSAFFALFREARQLHKEGRYQISEAERELIQDLDIGEFGVTDEGKVVPIDYPMLESGPDIDEATYKGKKVELNKPKRSSGGKAYVYVKTKKKDRKGRYRVKKVSFGSGMPDAMGKSEEHRKRRKSFGDRHNCAEKKDKTKPGYWSCRATKFFGRSIPGWW